MPGLPGRMGLKGPTGPQDKTFVVISNMLQH